MTDPITCAVGELTLRSAAVERALDALCWVLKHRRFGPFETTGQPLVRILERLDVLADEEEPELAKALRWVTEEVRDLKERRNHIVHGLWTPTDQTDTWQVTRAMKKDPIPQAAEFTVETVRGLSRRYETVQDAIIDLPLRFK